MAWIWFHQQCFKLLLSNRKMLNRFRCYLFAWDLIAFDISAICTVTLNLKMFRPSQYLLSRADFETVLHYKFNAHEARITIIAIAMLYTSSFIRHFTKDWGLERLKLAMNFIWADAMQTNQMLLKKQNDIIPNEICDSLSMHWTIHKLRLFLESIH